MVMSDPSVCHTDLIHLSTRRFNGPHEAIKVYHVTQFGQLSQIDEY